MPQTSPAARAILASGASRTQLDETGAREELAAYAFDQWAGSFALVPKPPRQFIRSVEAKYEYAAFLTSECEGRRVVWKEVAYRGTARVQPPPLRMSEVSPWSVDENALRLRSDHVATCDRCNGEGKRTCEQCRGSGHLTCRSCNGSGKVYGYTSNGARRLLNCKICHGHGFVTCPDCRRGIATCQICEGQKRVQRWMEVARWHRTEDVAYPLGIGDPPLSWPVNADNGVLEQDATIIGDVAKLGALSADDLRGIDIHWLQKASAKIANPPTSEEHIVRQRIRLVTIPRLRVAYAVGKHTGEIDFVGRRLLAMAEQPQFFEKRAARLRATAVGCVAIFALTAMAYLGRGAFYRHAAGLSVVALFGATLVGIFMVVAEATATRRRLKAWTIASAAAAAISAILFAIANPTVGDARARLQRGDAAGAAEELSVISGDANRADVRSSWADVHLANAKAARTYAAARKEAAAIPPELTQHRAAVATVDENIRKTVDQDLLGGRLDDAEAALGAASVEWRQSPVGVEAAERIYVPRAAAAIARLDWRLAADNLAAARKAGVAIERLSPSAESLRREATRRTRAAVTMTSAAKRFSTRLEAEQSWTQWERATGATSPELIGLRTSMAADLHDAERHPRRTSS